MTRLRMLGAPLATAWLAIAAIGCTGPAFTPLDDCRYRLDGTSSSRPLATTSLPSDLPSSGTYEIACTLPPLPVEHPAAWIPRYRSMRSVRVDGRPVPIDHWPFSLLDLSASERPATLVVELEAYAARPIGTIVIGPARELVESAITSELPSLAGATVMACASAVLLASALRRRRRELGWAALFWLSMSAIQLSGAPTLATAIHPGLLLRGWLLYTNLFVFTSCLARFMAALIDARSARLVRIVSLGHPVLFAIVVVLHVAHVADISSTFRISYPVTLACVAIGLPALIRAARAGAGAARTMVMGCAAMFVLSVPDMLDGADVITMPFPVATYGIWAFGIAMAFALERWERDGRDAMVRAERELARRVDELTLRRIENERLDEELRGQIARRSRELRELLAPGAMPRGASDGGPEAGLVDARYRVVRALGAGGMGAVYEVERTSDSRRLALKVMRGGGSPEHVARFMREAEIAAQIRHPNLVGIVDVGVTPGNVPYLVMELVVGRDLAHASERFGDVAWGVLVLGQLARGLAALHARGIVHRDIKPANVLLALGADGVETVKIADFGIARQDEVTATASVLDAASADTLAARPALTAMGALVGTPLYMAPETAHAPATIASDVFAMGVVAHELFARVRPFETPPVVIAWAGEPLPKVALGSIEGIPPLVAELVAAALSESPARRPTAAQIAEACAS